MTGGKGKQRRTRVTPNRRVMVRGMRRDPVDTRKVSRALLAIVQAQAEAEAQAIHEQQTAGKETRHAS
jgi:hypothetical protein